MSMFFRLFFLLLSGKKLDFKGIIPRLINLTSFTNELALGSRKTPETRICEK